MICVGEAVKGLQGVESRGLATVYLPVAVGSVQAFLAVWKGAAVAVVPVRSVWDGEGRRRGVGCVVRRS